MVSGAGSGICEPTIQRRPNIHEVGALRRWELKLSISGKSVTVQKMGVPNCIRERQNNVLYIVVYAELYPPPPAPPKKNIQEFIFF